jgi:hypothetical protein
MIAIQATPLTTVRQFLVGDRRDRMFGEHRRFAVRQCPLSPADSDRHLVSANQLMVSSGISPLGISAIRRGEIHNRIQFPKKFRDCDYAWLRQAKCSTRSVQDELTASR